MTHQPASSRPRLLGRGTPRRRRTLARLSGLAVFLTAAIGLAPAAWATNLPPPGESGAPLPPPPPSTTAAAHFPLWAVIAMVTATVVLSAATTLVVLSLESMRRSRHTPAASAEELAGYDISPADSR